MYSLCKGIIMSILIAKHGFPVIFSRNATRSIGIKFSSNSKVVPLCCLQRNTYLCTMRNNYRTATRKIRYIHIKRRDGYNYR